MQMAVELATPQASFAKEMLSVHKCECGKPFAHGPAFVQHRRFWEKAMQCEAHPWLGAWNAG
ncbi:MAG: hypothetical protein SGPRY_012253 [Prymnesium sp.]